MKIPIILKRPHPEQRRFIRSIAKRKVIKAGRRSGKTVGVSIYAVKRFLRGRRVLYATPTAEQIDTFWFEVTTALADAIASGKVKKNETRHLLWIPGTKIRIRAKTAWNANTLRGDYADDLILDEFQLMDENTWELVGAPMLADNNGDAILIYTPPDLTHRKQSKAKDPQYAAKLFKKAAADKTGRWEAFHFTSFDNPHVSHQAITDLAEDMTAVGYRMEILAEDVDEAPGALWTRKMIEDYRVKAIPETGLARIVVGVDPSETSTGNEAGIVACGIDGKGEYYLLADESLQGSPLAWAKQAVKTCLANDADRMVAEGNAGGEMVTAVIHGINQTIPISLVWATRGKHTRAAPIALLAEKGKIHHVGTFSKLEDELCLWVPGDDSPNRLDAFVWAMTFLVQHGIVKKAKQSKY
jgi:hypothetical protein